MSKWVVNLLDFNVYCDGERWFSSSRTIQVPVKFQRLLGNQALDVNLINNTTAIYSHPLHGRCKLILNSKRVIGVIKVVNGSLYQYTNDNLRDIFKPSIVSNLAHWFLISGKGSLGLIYDLTTGQKVYEISQAGALTHYNVQNCNVSGYVEKSLSINPQILEVFLKLDDISWVSFYIKDEQIIDFTRFKYPGKNHSLKVIWSEVEHKWLLQDNLNLAIDFDANYSQFSNYLPLKSVDGFLSFLLVPVADISSMGFTQKSNFDLKVPDDLFDRNSLNFDTIVFKVEDSNLVAGEKISDQIYLFYLLLSQKKYHFALKIIQELNCSRGDLESVEEYFNKWLEKNFASFKDFSPNAVATVLGAILILQQKTGQILFLSHSFSTLKDVYSSCKNSVDYSLKLDQFEITTINKKFYYATKMKWEISQFQISSCVASEILAELKLYKSKNPGSDEVDFLADYTKNFSNLYWEFIIKIRQSYNTTELYKVVYEIVYDETLVLKDIEKELLLHLVFWSQDDNHNIFQFRQLKLKRDKRDSRQLKAFCESFFKGLHESNLKRSSFQEILVSFHANQKQEVLQENLNIKNEEQQSKIVHSIYDNHLIDNFACNDLVQVEQKDQNFGFVDSIATCVPAPNYSNVSEYFHKKYLQDELFASKKQISIYTTKHSFIQIRDWLKNEIAEISKTEAKLKKNILGKINFRPTQYLISEHQLNLKSGNLKKTTINDICRILIKRNWFRLLKNLNPCLGYFEIKDIRQKAINYMLAFTEREYLSFIELDLGQGECLDESVLKRLNNCRQFDITENNLFPRRGSGGASLLLSTASLSV